MSDILQAWQKKFFDAAQNCGWDGQNGSVAQDSAGAKTSKRRAKTRLTRPPSTDGRLVGAITGEREWRDAAVGG